jgi:hypothetical protein
MKTIYSRDYFMGKTVNSGCPLLPSYQWLIYSDRMELTGLLVAVLVM